MATRRPKGGARRRAKAKGQDAEKRGVGRPTEYDPSFCARVIELGKEGKSRAEIASDLDCSRQTLLNWENSHPEFMDALSRAKDEELAWWESQSRTGINKGSAFNATLWAKSVNGRFPAEAYRERMEHTGAGGKDLFDGLNLSALSEKEFASLKQLLRNAGAALPG